MSQADQVDVLMARKRKMVDGMVATHVERAEGIGELFARVTG